MSCNYQDLDGSNISLKFLDIQLVDVAKTSNQNSINGAKGGRPLKKPLISGHTNLYVVRLFNVYGPGQDLANLKQGMVSIFCAMAIKDQKIVVKGSPDRSRDLIHVVDVVSNLVRCMKSDYRSPLDIGTGLETSVAELVEIIKIECASLFGFTVLHSYEEGFTEDIFRSRAKFGVETSTLLQAGITDFLRWTHQELIEND